MAPAAIIRHSTLTGTITHAALHNAINAAFLSLPGVTNPGTNTLPPTTPSIQTFQRTFSAAAKGTQVLQVSITSALAITAAIAESVSGTTLTGSSTLQATSPSNTVTTTGDVDIYTVNHAEAFGVVVRQSSTFRASLLWVRPANSVASWTEATFMKSLIPSSTNNGFRTGFPNPYNPTAASVFSNATPQATTIDTLTGDTTAIVAPPLFASGNNSIVNFSSDIISNGMTRNPVTEAYVSNHTGASRDYFQIIANFYIEGTLTL
jgi:hypothetical protein